MPLNMGMFMIALLEDAEAFKKKMDKANFNLSTDWGIAYLLLLIYLCGALFGTDAADGAVHSGSPAGSEIHIDPKGIEKFASSEAAKQYTERICKLFPLQMKENK